MATTPAPAYDRTCDKFLARHALVDQIAALEAAGATDRDSIDALRKPRLRLEKATADLVQDNLGVARG